MSKVKIAEIEASTEKFHAFCGLIKHAFSIIGFIFSVYIIFEGLEPFFKSNPDSIAAMSLFIEKLNISNVTGYVLSAAFGVAYTIERSGKKRAVQKISDLTQKVEANDAYRSSSGLTKEGNTPK